MESRIASGATAGSDPDEAELLAGLRAGDPQAYESIVRRFGGRMLAVARRILMNEDDAHDTVQEAFIAALRGMSGFAGESRLSTWLHRITVNAALMRLRRASRRQERTIETLLPRFLDDGHQAEPASEWQGSAEQMAQRAEVREQVRAGIEQLPEPYRVVLKLRDIEELTTDDTARLLAIAPGAVKVRLHRARQALRNLLDARLRGGVL